MKQEDLAKALSLLHKKDLSWLLRQLPAGNKAKVLRLISQHKTGSLRSDRHEMNGFWLDIRAASENSFSETVVLNGAAVPPAIVKALAEKMDKNL